MVNLCGRGRAAGAGDGEAQNYETNPTGFFA